MSIRAIEINFAIPVELSDTQHRAIVDLIAEIARTNTPEGHVHWLFAQGQKPTFSQADCRFLGKPIDPAAPESGEPTFDDSILAFETSCREI